MPLAPACARTISPPAPGSRPRASRRWGGSGWGLLLLFPGWALVACGGGTTHQGDRALAATVQLSPTPPMVGEAVLRVLATDAGAPLGPAARVEVTVGEAGSPVRLRREGDGWVGTARFVAPGSVTLVVEIESPDGRRATLRIPTTVSRATMPGEGVRDEPPRGERPPGALSSGESR